MAIVSHTIEIGAIQSDGLLSVVERYQRADGTEAMFCGEVAQGTDLNALATARIALIATSDAAAEITANIAAVISLGSLAVPTFASSTVAANIAALRAAYATSTQAQAIMIGDFLSSLTSAQLQTAFGITAGQVTTLRANKLTPAASAATTLRAAAGA